ncbi:MAG TPA: DUF1080 domain-containing protein, partial [Pirellulaceae bacterium]|nr:DUF1080 domain-containing protein [Pirellulaceae bacterium]
EGRPRGEVPSAAKTQQTQPQTPPAKPDSTQLDLMQPNSIELEAAIADAAQSGRLGVAVWGGAVDFADLHWLPLGEPAAEQPNANPPNAEQPNANPPLDLARHTSLLGASSLPPGWSHYDGQWTRLSEQVWQVAQNQGAKLIWDAQPLKSGEVEMEMRMTPGRAQIGGFILRVSEPKVGADNWFGYEVSLNAGDKSILFGEHRNNWAPRRSAPFPVKPGEWHHLRVVLDEARLRVFVDRPDEPQIDIDLPSPLAGAGVGLRTWGSEIQYRNVQVRRGSEVRLARWPAPQPQSIATTADADWARRQAVAALARVLFNSNEFVYVD